MRLFQKRNDVVGVHDKFIYTVETYAQWKLGFALIGEDWLSSNKEINYKNPRKHTGKVWVKRYYTLKYAPEHYLRNHGYKEI